VSRMASKANALNSAEDILIHSASNPGNTGDGYAGPKRNDKIMFFHVSQDIGPLEEARLELYSEIYCRDCQLVDNYS